MMASASFGRKGLSADTIGQPGQRRAQFGQAAAPGEAASSDPVAERRAAFLAAERARAADGDHDDGEAPAAAGRPRAVIVGGKSLATAYILWFFLGGFSAHRFYLGSPLTAIAQVSLWYVSLMFFMAGNPGAFYLMAAGWLWIIADLFFIPRLREAADEKVRRRGEQLLEPVSS